MHADIGADRLKTKYQAFPFSLKLNTVKFDYNRRKGLFDATKKVRISRPVVGLSIFTGSASWQINELFEQFREMVIWLQLIQIFKYWDF